MFNGAARCSGGRVCSSSTIATRDRARRVVDGEGGRKLLPRLLGKLLATQEVRVLCTSRVAIPSTRARTVEVKPLSPNDAARLFRELAMEALPADLRPLDALRSHPVLAALENLPRAIWQTVPLLRQGKTMAEIAKDLADATTTEVVPTRPPPTPATRAPRRGPSPRRRSARPSPTPRERRGGRRSPAARAPHCDPYRRRRRRRHHHGAADRGEAGERRRSHRRDGVMRWRGGCRRHLRRRC